jgi:hypothetical protein
MNSKEIRGSENILNLILINGVFHKVTSELVSYEMILCEKDIPNIYCIGYSKPLDNLYVHMRNDKRYIYEGFSVDKWQIRHKYDKINTYYSNEVRGSSFHETTEYIRPVPNEMVLDYYNRLKEWKIIHEGMWMTDRPDLIIDPENVLFQP